MKYIVISRTEDEPSIDVLSKEGLEVALNENFKEGYRFITSPPSDLMYFPSMSVLIIKGEIVTPKPVKTVVQLEID